MDRGSEHITQLPVLPMDPRHIRRRATIRRRTDILDSNSKATHRLLILSLRSAQATSPEDDMTDSDQLNTTCEMKRALPDLQIGNNRVARTKERH
jgi:hypothetical protein